ncbi:ZN574 protein, partial [Copsychus sechellarum]|nr:ZN574 protein [Copsychus sechellarum]
LFQSQELWLAHRQGHRNNAQNPPQSHARVDVEHSYRKPEDGDGGAEKKAEIPAEIPAEMAAPAEKNAVQLLLYECGECLQLFQSPKDFLEHQVTHLAPGQPPP